MDHILRAVENRFNKYVVEKLRPVYDCYIEEVIDDFEAAQLTEVTFGGKL